MIAPYILMALLAVHGAIAGESLYKCEDGPFNCTDEVAYICGTDGVTYLNHCQFFTKYCADNAINFAKEGKCDAKDGSSAGAKTPAPEKSSGASAKPTTMP